MRTWKWIILILLLACSCTREQEEEYKEVLSESYPEGATMQVTFALQADDPATKALGEGGELGSLYLAVFGKNGYLKEYVQANPVGTADYTYETVKIDAQGNPVMDGDKPATVSHTVKAYTFTSRLSLADSKRTVHLIGNGPSTLSFGWDSEVMASLCCSPGQMGYWQILELEHGIRAKRYTGEEDYIDGNGEKVTKGDYIDNTQPRGNKVTTKDGYVPDDETASAFLGPEKKGIALIRNWAKIEVTASENSNFVPKKFAVVEVPKYGTYAPYYSKGGEGKFITDYQNYSFRELENEGYFGNLPASTEFDNSIPEFTPVEDENHKRNAVYLYERPAPTSNLDPSYVIVYGHFTDPDKTDEKDDSGDYFYRVDLMETTPIMRDVLDPVTGEPVIDPETGEPEQEVVDWVSSYYPIYRNFKYTVNIRSILSRGQSTAEKAVTSAGSADVSADINTSSLDEISDGIGRLHLSWMNYTHISNNEDDPIETLFAYFSKNGVAAPTMIKAELLPAEDGGENIITDPVLGTPQTIDGSSGWVPINFTIKAYNGKVARTQVIRVTGFYGESRLYRDVYITVQPVQPMRVECSSPIIARVKDTPQVINFMIPDGLVSGMFPLDFTIEAEDMTLTPDQDVANNNLPVISGKSISDHDGYKNKTAFQFLRTLSWSEYRSLPQTRDANSKVWRTVPCYFRTNRSVSATTVWVYNSYFDKGKVTFEHYDMKQFNNLTFNEPIPFVEGESMSVSFVLEKDEGRDYPKDYPTITIYATGLRRDMDKSPDVVAGEGDTYTYKPKMDDPNVTLWFKTSGEGGNVSIDLTADEYDDGHLEPYHFSNVGFVDAMPLVSGNNKYSNSIMGHINKLANKTVIFAYRDDPKKKNAKVTVTTTLGGTTGPGLAAYSNKTPTFPWQNPVPVNADVDPLYHEIEFQTPGSDSYASIHVTLSCPGYVTQTITAGRWDTFEAKNSPYYTNVMNIMREDLKNVIKTGNIEGDVSGYWKKDYKCHISLPGVTVEGNVWKLPADGTYTLSISNSQNVVSLNGLVPESCPLFIVRLGFTSSKGVDYVPDSMVPSVGYIEPYPGGKNMFLWHIPGGNSATLTMTAPSQGIAISSMILADARNIEFFDQ